MRGDVARVALCATLAVACARSGTPSTTAAGSGVVTGTIAYRERIALPENAVVDVRLIDATPQDAAAPVIAQKTMETRGRQGPIPFELPYDASDIQSGHTYLVRAAIRSGDRLLFSTAAAHPVITSGNPTRVSLVLERVRTSADSVGDASARATVPLENTHWKLIILGGRPVRVVDNVPEPNMRLDLSQRRVRGNTGCNDIRGSYVLSGDSLRFSQVGVTRRACVDQEMKRQEGIFLDALDAARTWRVGGDTLTLSGEPGELARFAAVYLRE
jgi:putative lipoprotein